MQIILTCPECSYHEWGRIGSPLMNKIKLLNHASKRHPNQVEHILSISLPSHAYQQTAVA